MSRGQLGQLRKMVILTQGGLIGTLPYGVKRFRLFASSVDISDLEGPGVGCQVGIKVKIKVEEGRCIGVAPKLKLKLGKYP